MRSDSWRESTDSWRESTDSWFGGWRQAGELSGQEKELGKMIRMKRTKILSNVLITTNSLICCLLRCKGSSKSYLFYYFERVHKTMRTGSHMLLHSAWWIIEYVPICSHQPVEIFWPLHYLNLRGQICWLFLWQT